LIYDEGTRLNIFILCHGFIGDNYKLSLTDGIDNILAGDFIKLGEKISRVTNIFFFLCYGGIIHQVDLSPYSNSKYVFTSSNGDSLASIYVFEHFYKKLEIGLLSHFQYDLKDFFEDSVQLFPKDFNGLQYVSVPTVSSKNITNNELKLFLSDIDIKKEKETERITIRDIFFNGTWTKCDKCGNWLIPYIGRNMRKGGAFPRVKCKCGHDYIAKPDIYKMLFYKPDKDSLLYNKVLSLSESLGKFRRDYDVVIQRSMKLRQEKQREQRNYFKPKKTIRKRSYFRRRL